MELLFSKLISTLAVLLVIAGVVSGSDLLDRVAGRKKNWRYPVIAGVLGGLFGIYANLTGTEVSGAVISVRDVGPMLAGLTGGPLGGLLGGLICGAHRYSMGGITAEACVLATCCIGTASGFLLERQKERRIRPGAAFAMGVVMELFHLSVVLVMVKPFSLAVSIVRQIAVPFVLVNSVGFTLLILSISFIERKRSMDQERSRLQSELEVATVIQQSLLPRITDSNPGRPEIALSASMTAAKEVGGDFYDFFPLGDDRLVVIIADVSGKGVPAALFMATAKLVLQSSIRDNPDLETAVKAANDELCAGNQAGMFVTAWIGVMELRSGRLDYVCAGHNPPVLITAAGADYVRCRSCLVLGAFEGTTYRKESMTLNPGDRILLYTDGVTEAQNGKQELYGEDRLRSCLSSLEEAGSDDVIQGLLTDVSSFVGNAAQADDLTMLCLRRNALPEA